jgi:hypothetical protein
MIRETRGALLAAEARASAFESEAKHRTLLIEQMKFTIAKLRHEQYGGEADHRGDVLGACATQVLRPGAAQQGADYDRSDRTDRCAVRDRARHQRQAAPGAGARSQ